MAKAAITEAQMDLVTNETAKALAEQPKVKVRLFLSQDDKKTIEAAKANGKHYVVPYETVSVNGYTYQIQRGESVEVPQTVAEILEEAGLI